MVSLGRVITAWCPRSDSVWQPAPGARKPVTETARALVDYVGLFVSFSFFRLRGKWRDALRALFETLDGVLKMSRLSSILFVKLMQTAAFCAGLLIRTPLAGRVMAYRDFDFDFIADGRILI